MKQSKLEIAIHTLFDAIYDPYEAFLKRMFGDGVLYTLFLIAPLPASFAACFVAYIVIAETVVL